MMLADREEMIMSQADKRYSTHLLLILIGLLSLYIPLTRDRGSPISILLIYYITLALLILWLWRMTTALKFIFRVTPLDISLLGMLLLSLISINFSIDSSTSKKEFYKLATYTIIYYVVVNNIKTERQIRNLLIFMLTIASLVAIYGFCQHFLSYTLQFSLFGFEIKMRIDKLLQVQSVYGNPNLLAGYLALVIPLALGLFLANTRMVLKILSGTILTILSLCLLFTSSRGGFISIAFGMLFFLMLMIRKKLMDRKRVIIFTLILLILLGISVGNILRVRGVYLLRLGGMYILHPCSFKIRTLIWRSAINMIKDHPVFGIGLGTFHRAFPRYRLDWTNDNLGGGCDYYIKHYNSATAMYAHNDYLQYAAEVGIFSLIFFSLAIFFFIRDGLRIISNLDDKYWRWLSLGMISGLAGIAINSAVDFPLHTPSTVISTLMIAGLFISLGYLKSRTERSYLQEDVSCEGLTSTNTLVIGIEKVDNLRVKMIKLSHPKRFIMVSKIIIAGLILYLFFLVYSSICS